MSKYILKLYVTGNSPRSEQAIAHLKTLCDQVVQECELSVIDVLAQPEVAFDQRILATPTLVKEQPPPEQRIIGDFSNRTLVMNSLGLRPLRQGKTGRLA